MPTSAKLAPVSGTSMNRVSCVLYSHRYSSVEKQHMVGPGWWWVHEHGMRFLGESPQRGPGQSPWSWFHAEKLKFDSGQGKVRETYVVWCAKKQSKIIAVVRNFLYNSTFHWIGSNGISCLNHRLRVLLFTTEMVYFLATNFVWVEG